MTATAVPALAAVAGAGLRVPILGGGEVRGVNLDYAASAPALQAVADFVQELTPRYASVHRGAGWHSQLSTSVYEEARKIVGQHVGARGDDLVIFTRNTTDSLNLLASAVPGRSVVLDIEHHANFLPWVNAGATVVRAASTWAETLAALEAELSRQPVALVTITGASNVTGEVLPIQQIASLAHLYGARLAVDGAQLVPHRSIDIASLDVDYLAFSGHKTYAPYGAGVLVGRADWLDVAPPYLRGGGAVESVSHDHASWRLGAPRHEAGSPNVLGVAALARAVQELATIGSLAIAEHEHALVQRLVAGLDEVPGVRRLLMFPEQHGVVGVVGVVGFAVTGIDAGLVAAVLSAEYGIGVRHGLFCAHPLTRRIGGNRALLRASFGLGSSSDDVDALLAALTRIVRDGPQHPYALVEGQWEPSDDDRPRPAWAPRRFGEAAGTGCVV